MMFVQEETVSTAINPQSNSGFSNASRNIAFGLSAYFLYRTIKRRVRSFDFKNRVALVSGGSRGLGFILACQLAREGARVAIFARDGAELQSAKEKILAQVPGAEIFCQVCDATEELDVQDAMTLVIKHFGQ